MQPHRGRPEQASGTTAGGQRVSPAGPSGPRTGSIYDLGYRKYEGERLGRRYALVSLYTYSLRSIFGLGRSWLSKLFPIGLAVVASVPASVQVAIAAISPAEFELITAENYFAYVSIVLTLFCAVAAPEIIGRDQRHRTLSLYFSRALSRADYALAKLLALYLALFIVVIVPHLLLLLGQALADDDLVGNLRGNADQLGPVFAGSLLTVAVLGSVSLAIASQASRRAFSTGAVVAYFAISTALGPILVETLSGDGAGYALLVSPSRVLEGAIYWMFDAQPNDSDLIDAGLEGEVYFASACAYAALGAGIFLRRILRTAA
jgi:ABC-2 type transport system permease protein